MSSKRQKPAVKETLKREEISFVYLADWLGKIGSHIEDLARLLEENQDEFKNDPKIIGAQCLLDAYSSQLIDMAEKIRRPQQGGAE
jgi:hypothetical protein